MMLFRPLGRDETGRSVVHWGPVHCSVGHCRGWRAFLALANRDLDLTAEHRVARPRQFEPKSVTAQRGLTNAGNGKGVGGGIHSK